MPITLSGCIFLPPSLSQKHLDSLVVATPENLPTAKVGEHYYAVIQINPSSEISLRELIHQQNIIRPVFINGVKNHPTSEELKENIEYTMTFTNDQNLNMKLIKKSCCTMGRENRENQLIISGIPKKAGVYNLSINVVIYFPYAVDADYKIEVLP